VRDSQPLTSAAVKSVFLTITSF